MSSWEDCVALCGAADEDNGAVAAGNPIPTGEPRISRRIIADNGAAETRGGRAGMRKLRAVLQSFIETHGPVMTPCCCC